MIGSWLPSSKFFQPSCQQSSLADHGYSAKVRELYPFLPGLELILFLQILAVDVGRSSAKISASAKELQINTNFYEQYDFEIYYHLKL